MKAGEATEMEKSDTWRKVCQKLHTFFFYAQSPDFHKLGLCYYLKILYL